MTYVYIITDGDFYKIGVSGNFKKRLASLNTASPRKLKIVATRFFEERQLALTKESSLHEKYSMFRVNGEWFNITENEVIRIIDEHLFLPREYFIKKINEYKERLKLIETKEYAAFREEIMRSVEFIKSIKNVSFK